MTRYMIILVQSGVFCNHGNTNEVPCYFNISEYGRNILNRLEVTYERACMANPRDKYYEKMLDTLVDYNDHHNALLSKENLRRAISKVVAKTEEEERNIISYANNVTMDNFCKFPATTNAQGEN